MPSTKKFYSLAGRHGANEVEDKNANFLNTSVPLSWHPRNRIPLRADNLNEIHFFQSTEFFIRTNFRVYLLHFEVLLLTEQLSIGSDSQIRVFLDFELIVKASREH